jgi:hypothetical protein
MGSNATTPDGRDGRGGFRGGCGGLTVSEVIRSMLIRMTEMGTSITALIATLAVAAAGLLGSASGSGVSPGTALVIQAAAARDGRDLVDDRLDEVDAEVRLPRTAQEARTNLRYLSAQGHDIVVAGPQVAAAARATGVPVERSAGLSEAVAAVGR